MQIGVDFILNAFPFERVAGARCAMVNGQFVGMTFVDVPSGN